MKPQVQVLRRHFYKLAAGSLLVASLAGCGANPQTVTGLIALAKSVIELVDTFAEKSDRFTQRVNKVTDITLGNLNTQQEIGPIAQFWEKQWMDIHTRFDELNEHLQEINQRSSLYFQALDENNAKISNDQLRQQDFEKNQEIKKRWEIEYQKALTSMASTQQMLQQGDDFMYLLRNEVMRSTINASIPSLKQIAGQAVVLSARIRSFEQTARTIFQI